MANTRSSAVSKAQAEAARDELERRKQGLQPRRFARMTPGEIEAMANTDTTLLPSRKSRK